MSKHSDSQTAESNNAIILLMRIGTLSLFLISGVTGCAVVPAEEEGAEPTEALVEIMYATDRNVTGNSDVKTFFGEERGEMHYGVAQVAIRTDKSKSPFTDYSIWNLRFKGSISKRAELIRIDPLN